MDEHGRIDQEEDTEGQVLDPTPAAVPGRFETDEPEDDAEGHMIPPPRPVDWIP